jgi:hypothetical protein
MKEEGLKEEGLKEEGLKAAFIHQIDVVVVVVVSSSSSNSNYRRRRFIYKLTSLVVCFNLISLLPTIFSILAIFSNYYAYDS